MYVYSLIIVKWYLPKPKRNLVGLVFSINLFTLIDPIVLEDLLDSIKPIVPINSKFWFLIFKLKLLVRLDLTEVCIGGSFCCMSLMASSNEHWSLSSSC